MQDTLTVAQQLLGKYFVRRYEGGLAICQIAETEAYVGRIDRACHAFGYKKTERTKTLYLPGGHAYIYFTYGKYYCFNFVTEPEGEPSAVLLRGLFPCYGVSWLSQNRYGVDPEEMTTYQRRNFLNGPGKVCMAMALDRGSNAQPLTSEQGAFFVCESLEDVGFAPTEQTEYELHSGSRIGIDYAGADALLPWRYWLSPVR